MQNCEAAALAVSSFAPLHLSVGGPPLTKSKRLKTKILALARELAQGLRIGIAAKIRGESIMTRGYGTASLAIKVGYFAFAAVLVVFVSMLILTVLS
jgi:hypothetical protein